MPARLFPGPFPSWDDYRYFLATSEAGSFTKAASDLGVTQSTLSRRIDHLEQQLGVMDLTALTMCMENKIPVIVFDFKQAGNIERAVRGEPIGTLVTA